MKRHKQQKLNNDVITLIEKHLTSQYRPPSYKQICLVLNNNGTITARGNNWTPQRLFRMLQRQGISGLNGLHQSVFHRKY